MLRTQTATLSTLSSFTLSKPSWLLEYASLFACAGPSRWRRVLRCSRPFVCFRALKIDPKNHVLLSNRSAAYVGLEKYNKALQDATACIQISPEFVKGYSRQAYAYVKLSKPGLAEKAYRQGLKLDSTSTALKQGLASILKVQCFVMLVSTLRRRDCPCMHNVCMYWTMRRYCLVLHALSTNLHLCMVDNHHLMLILQGDGDQSSRSTRQKNDQTIRNTMARVGEMFPYHLAREPNQPLIRALCNFDVDELQSMFEPEWLSYRATPNHLPITSLVVALAQRTSAPKQEALPKYTAILEWLIDEGARVDARDIGGYTALGHAAAHTPVLSLAEVLLRKGANVNDQNRFGATVLMSAVMSAQVNSCQSLQQCSTCVHAVLAAKQSQMLYLSFTTACRKVQAYYSRLCPIAFLATCVLAATSNLKSTNSGSTLP